MYWGPVLGYAGLIFYLSAQSHPDDDLPSLFWAVNDKVLHALEYAGLGGLCYRAFRWGATGSMAARALLFSILAASLFQSWCAAAVDTPASQTLTWQAVSGAVFRVEYADSYLEPVWQPLGVVTAASDSFTIIDDGVAAATSRLYRAISLP